jgi:hypothetical protein
MPHPLPAESSRYRWGIVNNIQPLIHILFQLGPDQSVFYFTMHLSRKQKNLDVLYCGLELDWTEGVGARHRDAEWINSSESRTSN